MQFPPPHTRVLSCSSSSGSQLGSAGCPRRTTRRRQPQSPFGMPTAPAVQRCSTSRRSSSRPSRRAITGIVVKDATNLRQPAPEARDRVAGGQLPDLVRSDIIWVPELANLGVARAARPVMPDFRGCRAGVPRPLATNNGRATTTAPARHEHAHLDQQPGSAHRPIGASGPPTTFAQLKSMSAGEGEGPRPLRRKRHQLLERLPVDLVERGQHRQQDLDQGDRVPERPEECRGDPDARRPVQGRRQMPGNHRRQQRRTRHVGRHQPGQVRRDLDGPWSFAISPAHTRTFTSPAADPAGSGRQRQRRRRRGHRHDEGVQEQDRRRGVPPLHARPVCADADGASRADAGHQDFVEVATKIHPYYATYLKQIATANPARRRRSGHRSTR